MKLILLNYQIRYRLLLIIFTLYRYSFIESLFIIFYFDLPWCLIFLIYHDAEYYSSRSFIPWRVKREPASVSSVPDAAFPGYLDENYGNDRTDAENEVRKKLLKNKSNSRRRASAKKSDSTYNCLKTPRYVRMINKRIISPRSTINKSNLTLTVLLIRF